MINDDAVARLRAKGFIYKAKGTEITQQGNLEPWLRTNSVWSAARHGNGVLLKRMIESDPTLANKTNTKNETALHIASAKGNFECAQVLVQLGAKSVPNARGQTPLHLAAANGHANIVRMLVENSHTGSDQESCKQIIAAAANKSDFATMSVLQAHLEPSWQNLAENEKRKRQIEQKRADDTAQIQKAGRDIQIAATTIPTLPQETMPQPAQWKPAHLVRWIQQLLPQQHQQLHLENIKRYHIDGKTMARLQKGEIQSLLQTLGIPTPFRTEILKAHTRIVPTPIYSFTDIRQLPLAIGNAITFRIIGYVNAAMSTPLHTLRRFVSTNAHHASPIPKNFLFSCQRDATTIQRNKENQLIVSNIGFIVILTNLETECI